MGGDPFAARARAPAIGVAAAYGVVVGMQSALDDAARFDSRLAGSRRLSGHQPADGGQSVLGARPHARAWRRRLRGASARETRRTMLLDEAQAIEAEDRQMCRAIGRHGAELLATARAC